MILSHPTLDVLCVGHASYDLILTVDHHPGEDEKCSASHFAACGGGPAANAAVTVARLGGKAAFAGQLGRDPQGDAHAEELDREGVLTDWIVRRSHPTPLSVILVKPDGKRTVVNHQAQTPPLPAGAVDFSCCRPKAILLDGHEPLISPPLARWARGQGIPTILDAGSVREGTLELAPRVDYLAASWKFARDFTGEKDPDDALAVLSRIAPCAVITLGEEGLVWQRGMERGRLPAFSVEAADTTGAGDVFHGAFALGLTRGQDFHSLLTYASAAGALCCRRLGARPSIPTGDEVEAFLKSF